MSSVTITLPSKALENVRKMAEYEGKSLEEYIAEVLLKQLGMDPEAMSSFT
jgi:predicted DNA binding CopG/RHH family protein